VADYAAALLRHLRKFGDVGIGAADADVCLYHLGNNQIHHEIYRRALERPGVAVLHDAVLQHFFLGSLDEDGYVEEFVYNYGEWHRELAREMWLRRAGSSLGARYFEYPMLKRVAERSRAVVVHNRAAGRMVREHAPGAKVIEIPHLFEPQAAPGAADVLRFRERLGIGAGDFVIGLFGYLRESKRVMGVLRAFAEARRAVPRCVLLAAGDFVSSDLKRAAAPLLEGSGVVRLPYLQDSEFRLAGAATDLCVNLRYPAAGETSGITVRMMGAGKAVALSSVEENQGYPEAACVRVDPGPTEIDELRDYLVLAASSPGVVREVGRRAAEHIAAHHGAAQAAELYWKALCGQVC
jgi:glycosyltransferase involved in cell wall biosynthesis